jgi:hypothetical protein
LRWDTAAPLPIKMALCHTLVGSGIQNQKSKDERNYGSTIGIPIYTSEMAADLGAMRNKQDEFCGFGGLNTQRLRRLL